MAEVTRWDDSLTAASGSPTIAVKQSISANQQVIGGVVHPHTSAAIGFVSAVVVGVPLLELTHLSDMEPLWADHGKQLNVRACSETLLL